MTSLPTEVEDFVSANDFSPCTVKAIRSDLTKFVSWFAAANGERFDPKRVTVRDVADFRTHLHDVRRQATSTTNRALVSIRRFLRHLVGTGALSTNPAASVKELRRVPTAPRGLTPAEVRRVMRETELRGDVRSGAIFGLLLFAGLRVSDVVWLELIDVEIGPRSGQVSCRRGKGNKLRIVPLSAEARRLLSAYLEVRPPSESQAVFIGERGPLKPDGVRSVCSRYAATTGVKFTPHVLRHSFAHRFLQQTSNDLVALAQILGHENLNTTAIYSKRSGAELQQRVDSVRYE